MASKININLDTSKENYLVTKCKQNDNLTLEAFIYENGLALDLTNKTITIQALKSDNTYIIQNTDIVKENNKINAELDRDFSRVPGTTKIEIVLVESSKQNTTFSFYLEVVASVIRGAVQSSNTATILEALDNKIIEAGQVKQETEELIESGGAAKKEDIININASLDFIKNDITKYGAIGDGVTPCDSAFNVAKTKGNIHFPQNSNNNAIYYFTNKPNLDGVIVSADDGVKLSFPDTNLYSFKTCKIEENIQIISRDRDNTGTLLKNILSKYSYIGYNDSEQVIKKVVPIIDTDYIKEVNYATGYVQTAHSIASASNREGYYKISDGTANNKYKYQTLSLIPEVGYEYRMLYYFFENEINTDFRIGVGLFTKNTSKWQMITLDNLGNIYKNTLDSTFQEVALNTIKTEGLLKSYMMSKASAIAISIRVIASSKAEVLVNGVLVGELEIDNVSNIGFVMNHIKGDWQGEYNCYFGRAVKFQNKYTNIGLPLKLGVFGDSKTFGEGSSLSWANHLKNLLEGYRGINKVEVDNFAISGQKTSQQLAIMQTKDLSSYTHIVINLGTNDIQQGVTSEQFKADLTSMLNLANGKKVVVAIPSMWISKSITGVGFASANYEKGEEFRQNILLLQPQFNFVIADLEKSIGLIAKDNCSNILRDNLHENDFGQLVISKCMAKAIIETYANDIVGESNGGQSSPSTTHIPTLQNGWVAFGGGYATPRVVKNGNIIHVEGLIKSGITTAGTVVFNLPSGYRPLSRIIEVLATQSGSATVDINTNGDVSTSVGWTTPTWISLSMTFTVN